MDDIPINIMPLRIQKFMINLLLTDIPMIYRFTRRFTKKILEITILLNLLDVFAINHLFLCEADLIDGFTVLEFSTLGILGIITYMSP